jgi:hypothetical protein
MSIKGRCKRKVKRTTMESAQAALAERQAAHPNREWEIYTCAFCGFFHVGTKDTPAARMRRNPSWLRRVAERKNARPEYRWTAMPVVSRWSLSAVLAASMATRVRDTTHITDREYCRLLFRAAWDDAGYSLDAPETFPAGGCENVDVEEIGSAMPAQLTIQRENHDA